MPSQYSREGGSPSGYPNSNGVASVSHGPTIASTRKARTTEAPITSFVLCSAKCSVSKRFPRGPSAISPAPSPVSAISGVATRSALGSTLAT